MNHNRYHCNGEGCPKTATCLRKRLQDMKQADGVQYATYVDAEECMKHDFHFYMNIENMEPDEI